MKSGPQGEPVEGWEIRLDYSTGPRADVSPQLYAVLKQADGRTPLSELGLTRDLHAELYNLWQERFFTLTPIGR
ncbi:hypothetical protein [Amycolatopsis orientalis]|uniref:hypothetical protein n=1 Tax=Amycolatopsis orientalis TaxID=31958 RepID=UPI001F2F397A|nr:hypothetical protein [Amycolatopsis orientalis]